MGQINVTPVTKKLNSPITLGETTSQIYEVLIRLSRPMSQRQFHASAKPPNILLLCDNQSSNGGQSSGQKFGLSYQQAKADLTTCIGRERYVIYPLALEDVSRLPWRENCQLLIAPASLNLVGSSPDAIQHLRSFVEGGGRCLSMNGLLSEALASNQDEPRRESADMEMTSKLCHVVPCVKGEKGLDGFIALSLYSNPPLFGAATSNEGRDLVCTPLGHLHPAGADANSTSSPLPPPACIHLVSDRCGQSRYVSSTVELLPPSLEDLTVSMVTELKQATRARHTFLRAVLHQLGVECAPSSPASLSYTFLFAKTNEVS